MSGFVEIDFNPPARVLRQFGVIALVAFGALAFMAEREMFVFKAGLGQGREAVVWALAGVAGLSGFFSLVAPRANRVLFVGLSVLAFPIGFVVSHILLGLLFFGLIAPLGFAMKLSGRDALTRAHQDGSTSYWVKARRRRAMRDYFRQY